MTKAAAIEKFYTHYLAPNGLARLDVADNDGNDGVLNENGILFLAIFCELTGWKPAPSAVKKTLECLEVEPGLYCRQYRNNRTNSADNYLGHIVFGQANDIVAYGKKHWWHFNNVRNGWKWECVRQPGEVAFYKLMAGKRSSMLGSLHLAIGLVINAMNWGGDHQLCWLRRRLLSKVKVPYIVAWAMALHKRRFKWNPATYYHKDHPILEVWDND